jgi:hypothetical protein
MVVVPPPPLIVTQNVQVTVTSGSAADASGAKARARDGARHATKKRRSFISGTSPSQRMRPSDAAPVATISKPYTAEGKAELVP